MTTTVAASYRDHMDQAIAAADLTFYRHGTKASWAGITINMDTPQITITNQDGTLLHTQTVIDPADAANIVARAIQHIDAQPAPIAICDCGHAPNWNPRRNGTGYARKQDNTTTCYDCADTAQRDHIAAGATTFAAYLATDGKTITTWTGAHLATITRSTTGRPTAFGQMTYVRATTPDGRPWHGRGRGPGEAVTMHAAKTN